ncbi:hypothetical protein GpartN1_g2769.t1 [Galdieria partita]|uniref:Deoxynucleoside kinase domain-containing protein n=1 Tax=Galdieria partita TaxID=83374 RepID=A0A9C7PUB0_9RHOD|nr:hypothetical protein GpartN1_g2769.t1 [Galdieria partita]
MNAFLYGVIGQTYQRNSYTVRGSKSFVKPLKLFKANNITNTLIACTNDNQQVNPNPDLTSLLSAPGSLLLHDLETIHQLVKDMKEESFENQKEDDDSKIFGRTLTEQKFRFLQDLSGVIWNEKVAEALKHIRELTLTQFPYEEACMMISPEQGKFLSFLVRAIGARRCLEIGTFTGYSSVCIAAAMREDNESILYCLEHNESYARTAQREWTSAGLLDKVRLVLGDAMTALQNLAVEKRGWFDFIFVDAEKEKYREYYEISLALLRVGGVLCIDDTCWSGRVADEKYQDSETLGIRDLLDFMQQDSRVFACPIPIFDGMVVALKLPTTSHCDKSQILLSQKIIDVEGNIAVGKTCLVQSLLSRLETRGMTPCVFEEDPNHAFLAAFYDKPETFGFSFQMYMLKLAQQVVIKSQHYLFRDSSNVALIDRSVWGNRVFAECNYHLGNFSREEYEIYESVYNETQFQPDYLIYLDASPTVCLERAKKRGRSAEQGLQLSYLEALDTFHLQHLISTIFEGRVKVLVFNCHIFCTAEQILEKMRGDSYDCKLIWNDQSTERKEYLWFLHLPEDCYYKMAKGMTNEEWFDLLYSWNLFQTTEITDICLPWLTSQDQVTSYQYQAFKRLVCFALSASITVQFYKHIK